MENYRLSVKNNTKIEIRNLKKILEKAEKTLFNLRQQKYSEFIKNKIIKLEDKIISSKENIKKLSKKLSDIDKGLLDDEIEANIENENKEMEEKIKLKKKRKDEVTKFKNERKKISKEYYESHRQSSRKQRYNQRGWKSCYNYYTRTSARLPNYMKKNLENMPNNKGYYWRDIAFYGELPPNNSGTTVLFQKERDGSMIIHEWTKSYYLKYCKKTKKDKKKLISKIPRKIK